MEAFGVAPNDRLLRVKLPCVIVANRDYQAHFIKVFPNPSFCELLSELSFCIVRTLIMLCSKLPHGRVKRAAIGEGAQDEQFLDELRKAILVRVIRLIRFKRGWRLTSISVFDADNVSSPVKETSQLVVAPSHIHAGMRIQQ